MSNTFRVINKYKDRVRPNAYALNIMRPGLLGNKFEIGKDGTREEVVYKYKVLLPELFKSDTKIRAVIMILEEALELGVEIDFVCCCKPLLCHGDVLVDFIESRAVPF